METNAPVPQPKPSTAKGAIWTLAVLLVIATFTAAGLGAMLADQQSRLTRAQSDLASMAQRLHPSYSRHYSYLEVRLILFSICCRAVEL